ncbi:SDR family oxidoreductase [Rhodococcus sp. TAF43]|uniref:SDR family oxidoreductase n=1 Tax=unclassified Rhodococcus (in: high G+C Gram-positive bacteria) TaxID=192944 RepID=UPI001582A619|nr:SDR family oxidoreductase [Rhodococcus sp. W8901]QKT10461.1 SDR family oxidoreductase [Rhodococcus sp. W8901]
MTRSKRTLLLTGGSGVIGRAVLDAMAEDFDIVCLRGRRPIDDPRVSEFAGDFTHPTLGLPATDYAALVNRVDVVLHGAAVTKWNVDPERLRAVNVQGPASMLRVAADADAPLYYLSTAFVIRQAPADERFAGLAAYLESKTEAEELIRAGSVPAVILRPSVVTGDSRDGRMAAFQGLHRMLGNAVRGNLPVVPGEIESLVDTVPLDIVVEAVGKLIREDVTEGEYWLTAGDQALTFTDIAELCEYVSRLAWIGAVRPRFMPFESVDRLLLPLLDDLISDGRRRMFIDFLESVWVFQSSDAMPSDLDRLGFGDRATKDALTEALRRSLIYWAQVKKLLPAEPPVVESAVR